MSSNTTARGPINDRNFCLLGLHDWVDAVFLCCVFRKCMSKSENGETFVFLTFRPTSSRLVRYIRVDCLIAAYHWATLSDALSPDLRLL